MADQLAQLDTELAFLDQIAAELERQVGPSPVTRTLVIAWLTEWVKNSGAADQASTALFCSCGPASARRAPASVSLYCLKLSINS